MKKRQRGILFTALTLVLGFAVVTTAIATPQLRIHVGAEQTQRVSRAALRSPIFAELETFSTGSRRVRVVDQDAVNWATDDVPIAVFGNREFIAPGDEGVYNFTLTNLTTSAIPIVYKLSFAEGTETTHDFPVEYSLDDGDNWYTLDVLIDMSPFRGEVDAGQVKPFALRWHWVSDDGAGRDTAIGAQAAQFFPVGEHYRYQLILKMDVAHADPDYRVGGVCDACVEKGITDACDCCFCEEEDCTCPSGCPCNRFFCWRCRWRRLLLWILGIILLIVPATFVAIIALFISLISGVAILGGGGGALLLYLWHRWYQANMCPDS
jgi:hypothetical protein